MLLLDNLQSKLPAVLLNNMLSFYIAIILFGQVFLSSLANLLSIENRSVMVVFRLSIMIFSYAYIFFCIRSKQFSNFLNSWTLSLLMFWLLYIFRLFYDVYAMGVTLALPVWELLAWSLGSSLPIAMCSYLLASQNSLDFVFIKQVNYGIFFLGFSIICFLIDPGLGQGRFYLQHLNAITCANAGCALILLSFAKLLLKRAGRIRDRSIQFLAWLGIVIGAFIVIYSATRGVIISNLFIICSSIFLLRSRLRLSSASKWKYLALLSAILSTLISMILASPVLLEKLFTSISSYTILTRLEFWRVSIEQFVASPLVGEGFKLQEILGNLEIEKGIYYPHNYVLESLAIGGVVMTLPLLFIMCFPIISLYKKPNLNPALFPMLLLVSQALIYSMHNGHLGDFPFFWLTLGMIAGFKNSTDQRLINRDI